MLDTLHAGTDQALDLFGRLGTAPGKRPHFGGNHGKTTTLFTGTGSFHRRIQGQNIGLEGNAVNDADDGRDTVRRLIDALHGVYHLAHHLTAFDCDGGSIHGQLIGLARRIGVLLDGGAKLLHRGSGFFQGAGLGLGAGRQVLVALRDFGACGGNALRAGAYPGNNVGQALLHMLQLRHHAVIVSALEFNAGGQISFGHILCQPGRFNRLRSQLFELAFDDFTNDKKQHNLQQDLADPDHVFHLPDFSYVFGHVHDDAHGTQNLAFLHSMAVQAFRRAKLLMGYIGNDRTQR